MRQLRAQQRIQRILELALGLAIHRACAIVENQHTRARTQRAGNGDALLLPAGEIDPALPDVGRVAIRHRHDEIVRLRRLRRRVYLLIRGVGAAISDVVAHRAAEQHRLLERDAHLRAQVGHRPIAHIHAIHQHAAPGNIVEARNQVDEAGFSRARCAQNGNGFSGFGDQIHIGEGRVGAAVIVAEANILEDHTPGGRGRLLRRGGRLHIRFGIEHLQNAPGGGFGGGKRRGHADQHHQREEREDHVVDRGHDLPHAHFPCDSQIAAEPDHARRRQVDNRHHQRHQNHDEVEDLDGLLHQVIVGAGEALIFVLGAHKGFDHAHAREVFLHHGIELIQLFLDDEKQRARFHEEPDHNPKDEGEHGEPQPGHLARGENQHDQRPGGPQRGARENAQAHHQDHLHLADVAGGAHEQLPGLHAIQVAEGERLHLAHEVAADVRAGLHPHAHGEDDVGDRDERLDHGDAEHQQCGVDDKGQVLSADALINDALGQAGDRQIGGHHAHQQQQRRDGLPAVRAHVFE